MQSECNVSYFHLRTVWICLVLSLYLLLNSRILEKNVTGHKICFDFLYNSCTKYSHSTNSEGQYPKYTQAFTYSAHEACQIFDETWIVLTLKKNTFKLQENQCSGSCCSVWMDGLTRQIHAVEAAVLYGWTDWQDKSMQLKQLFCMDGRTDKTNPCSGSSCSVWTDWQDKSMQWKQLFCMDGWTDKTNPCSGSCYSVWMDGLTRQIYQMFLQFCKCA
jgi:hypothetical protein